MNILKQIINYKKKKIISDKNLQDDIKIIDSQLQKCKNR